MRDGASIYEGGHLISSAWGAGLFHQGFVWF